jgi:hypothetical protein
MAFVTPTGYSPTSMGHSPRSGTTATFGMTSTPSNSTSDSTFSSSTTPGMESNAIAGPSYSGGGVGLTPRNWNLEGDSRRESQEEDM